VDQQTPNPWSAANFQAWADIDRPLSDIKELTEPSLIDLTNYRKAMLRHHSKDRATTQSTRFRDDEAVWHGQVTSPDGQKDGPCIHRLSLTQVPPRSSSNRNIPAQELRIPDSRRIELLFPRPPHWENENTIPNHGSADSPVKDIAAKVAPVYFRQIRRVPSRTFVRSQHPNVDELENPIHRHPHVAAEIQVGASLFVGGGSIEGHVRVAVHDTERLRNKHELAISRVSIDLLGIEELSNTKRDVFLNLATELLDSDNPPPHTMVELLKEVSPGDPFWPLALTSTNLPFMLSLPLDVGPPPFSSKHAKIRYMLAATLLIRESGKQYLVRSSQKVSVISVYDPEKALVSLPSPLTASDEYIRHRESGTEALKITAGLHRQVWVSGTSIFVDVHIANSTSKHIKRLEMQLERNILCYNHAPASTSGKLASEGRIFDFNDRTIFGKHIINASKSTGWTGVPGQSSDLRTFDIELPRGQATIRCGKYFEVRYFLNIIIGTTSKPKLVTVQLPIVLIHITSLDVVPNSVAQVAAAIEERRARTKSDTKFLDPTAHTGASPRRRRSISANGIQGQAFAAPRKQSLDRIQARGEDLAALGRALGKSPRKYQNRQHQHDQRGSANPRLPPPRPPRGPLGLGIPLPLPPNIELRDEAVAESYTYRTPPKNDRDPGHRFETMSSLDIARAKVRRMRSLELFRSDNSLFSRKATIGNDVHFRDSGRVMHRKSEDGGVSKGIQPTNPTAPSDGNASLLSRPGLGIGRPPFRRMRSIDRWRVGASWFRDRSRIEEDRSKPPPGNWI
jgi:hypothetical protein